MTTQQLNRDALDAQQEGRGLCRVLVWAAVLACISLAAGAYGSQTTRFVTIPSALFPLGTTAASSRWPAWSTTPYPLSKAFAAYRRTFAEPDAEITYSDGPAHGQMVGAFYGGVVIPDGRVVMVPYNSPVVGIYDPATGEYSDGPAHRQGSSAFYGGVVIPDGRVVLVPYNSPVVGILSAGAAVPLDASLSPILNKL